MTFKTRQTATLRMAALTLSLCALTFSIPATAKSSVTTEERPFATNAKLEQMAEAAQCAAEHGEVAKQYRLRAETLDAKANEHERKAAELEKKPKGPMHSKWPAMASKPWVKERDLALQTRRAAKEAQQLADRHVRLGVETLSASCRQNAETPVGN